MRVGDTDDLEDHMVQELGEAEVHTFDGAFPRHDERSGYGIRRGDYKGGQPGQLAAFRGYDIRVDPEMRDWDKVLLTLLLQCTDAVL